MSNRQVKPQIYAFLVYSYKLDKLVAEAFDLRHVPKYFFWQNRQATQTLENLSLDLVRNLPDHEGDWSIVFSRTFDEYVGHIFHSVSKQGFIVVTNRSYPQENVHVFFQQAIQAYHSFEKINQSPTDILNNQNQQLNRHLANNLSDWNDNPEHNTSKLTQLDAELDQVKNILEENIQKVIQRGESLEELLLKSQHITDTSKTFLKRSKKLNRCCNLL